MLAGTAAAMSGSGTVDDPYVIESKEDLNLIKENTYKNAYITMNKDIDANGLKFVTPVTVTTNFGGNFNGNNYTISNLTISNYNDSASLFGSVKSATIQNVVFENVTVQGKQIGLISSYMDGSAIKNVHVKNSTIKGLGGTGGTHIGGFVSQALNTEISDSSFSGNVINSVLSGQGSTGGIVGVDNTKTSQIKNVTVSGKVYAPIGYPVAGIIGNNAGLVSQCYVDADIIGAMYVAGIAGHSNGTIQDCFVTGSISAVGKDMPYDNEATASGICGHMREGGLIKNTYSTSKILSNGYAFGISSASGGTIENSFALNEYVTSPTVYRISDTKNIIESYSWEYMTNNGTQIPMEGTEISMDEFWNTYNDGSDIWNTWSDSIWTLNTNENFLLPVLSKLGGDVEGDMSWVNFEPSGPEVIYKTVGGGGSNGTVTVRETVYVDSGSGSNGTEEKPITPGNPIGFGNDIEPESGFNWWIAISGLLFVTLVVAGFYIRKCQKDLNERRI